MSSEYRLHEISERADLDALMKLWFNARWNPYVPYSWILSPVLGDTEDDRARALAATQQRVWEATRHDTSISRRWICVKDARDVVIGGAQWQWFAGSPFPNGRPSFEMHWWPEGEARKFCEEMLAQVITPRSIWMQREHGSVSVMIVHPKHRCRGVGSLIMDYINARLDRLGIEGFIEASEDGRMCYQKNGYQPIMKLDFYVPPHKGDLWQKLYHELKPQNMYLMWRPVKGGPDPDGRTRPWQLGQVVPI